MAHPVALQPGEQVVRIVAGAGLPDAITPTADGLGIEVHRNASGDEG